MRNKIIALKPLGEAKHNRIMAEPKLTNFEVIVVGEVSWGGVAFV
jgi:hypothetical protein